METCGTERIAAVLLISFNAMRTRLLLCAGGASGLGLSLAVQLARRGVSVTLLDLQKGSEALDAVDEAAEGDARSHFIRVDVTDYEQACPGDLALALETCSKY